MQVGKDAAASKVWHVTQERDKRRLTFLRIAIKLEAGVFRAVRTQVRLRVSGE
jgi:hypothetical protein